MFGTALIYKGPFYGTSALEGKKFIYDIIQKVKPVTGLDIGCGSGTYARLFPEIEWTGVEVWEPYVEKFVLNRLYEKFILADAREWEPTEQYDIAIAGDVLEHMTQEEAVKVFNRLKACAKTVIVSIPVIHYPQDALGGNPYETHVVEDWDVNRVRSVFGEPDWYGVELPVGIFVWGKI